MNCRALDEITDRSAGDRGNAIRPNVPARTTRVRWVFNERHIAARVLTVWRTTKNPPARRLMEALRRCGARGGSADAPRYE